VPRNLPPSTLPLTILPFSFLRYDQYQYQAEDEQQQEDGGRRKLENVQYVNCDTCASMGCFQQNQDNGNNENQVTLEGMVEWVEEMSQCQDTGVQYNNIDLRAGFMCNEDGTGVELAVFLDDECSVYHSQQSYQNIVNSAYAANSQSVVTYPFVNDIDCSEDPEWESPENMNNDDNNNNNQDENEPEANEFCQQLLQSEFIAPLDYCAYNNDGANNDNNNNNQNENQNQNQYFYGYEYDLTDEESEEPYYVCTALNKMQNEGSSSSWKKNAAKKNMYNSDNSGKFYDYSARTSSNSSSTGNEGGKIAAIIIGVVVAFGLAFVAWKQYSKKQDSRKEPLVSEGLA